MDAKHNSYSAQSRYRASTILRPTLILGAVPRVAVPVARSLAHRGVPAFCVGFGPDQQPIRSRAISRSFSLPALTGDGKDLLDDFVAMLQRENIDYLMPCNDSSLRFIAAHFDAISQVARPACPGPIAIRRVLDKTLTLSAARACSVPVPRQVQPGPAVTIDQVSAELSYPVVAKPIGKLGRGEFKVKYFHNRQELLTATGQDPEFFQLYLIQEYCPGEGVGIEILMYQDEPRIIFQHRRLTEYPRSGGVSVVASSEPADPALKDMAVRLLQALGWNGVAMVEFRHDQCTGRTALMEVNGRYWGSLGLSAACGIEFPYTQWAYDHGVDPGAGKTPLYGVRARWTAGVLLNIGAAADAGRWKEIGASLAELSPGVRDMVFDWRDPIPALMEFTDTFLRQSYVVAKSAVRALIPSALWGDILLARKHGAALPLRLRRRKARRRRGDDVPLPKPLRHIVFVCHGNIIRSAFAACLLARIATEHSVTVSSAGLSAKSGRPADPRAVAAAQAVFGIDLTGHAATLFTEQHLREADLVCVMDRENEIALLARYPTADRKVFLLGQFCPALPLAEFEIPDPYLGAYEDVVRCYHSVFACIQGLVNRLETRS